jgi:hypothetical protein
MTRYINWSNCYFGENDILFNDDDFDFTLDPPGWPGEDASIEIDGPLSLDHIHSRKAIAMHELGHFFGLDHQGGWPDTMNATYPTGSYADYDATASSIEFEVAEDARQGLRYLYPDNSTGQDLAISNWRWGYYTLDPDDPGWIQCHPGIWHDDLDTSYAIGDSIQVWFNYVNLGTSTQYDVNVGIYLSSDSSIETSDSRIAAFDFTAIAPNTPALVTTTTTIPRGTPLGQKYLGAIIDTNDEVSEYNEGNNTNVCAGSGGHIDDEPIKVTITIQ